MSMTIEKLKEIREETLKRMNLRGLPSDKPNAPYRWSVAICMETVSYTHLNITERSGAP